MSWLDAFTIGRQDATSPVVPPPPVYDGGAERARNRQSYTATMRNEAARNRGAMTGAAMGAPVNYGAQIDPMEVLAALGWGQDSGGGGVRTIDNRPQVRDRYNAMREQAEGRYGSARVDMGQLYDQLAAAYQGLPEQAARRFQVASEGATDQTERLMQETAARVNEEAAARAAQAAELGIDPTAMEDLTETVDYQTGEMGRTGANWSGLMGALSASEQTRGQLAYEGALDTGVMAKQDLLSRYNDYLAMLDERESQELMGAIQQVATGSGRSAANLPAGVVESLMMESFYQAGIIQRPGSGESGGRQLDVTDEDLRKLSQELKKPGGTYQNYLENGGSLAAIEAAKDLGWTIPSWFMQPSVSVTPGGWFGSGGTR
jgi:hypothetical protein